MVERDVLLKSIATTIEDYRVGELSVPVSTPEHIDRWVKRFDAEVQHPILLEMDHVLSKTYLSKKKIHYFLKQLITKPTDPSNFWKNGNFLNIQKGGDSQRDLLCLFDENLKAEQNISIEECKSNDTFFYIDDVIFTGNRVKTDLTEWINNEAPNKATVYVVVLFYYTGFYYYKDEIANAISATGKDIKVQYECLGRLENLKSNRDSSDVLWPVGIPDDSNVHNYVDAMRCKPIYRTAGGSKIFSSDEGRQLLEQEFLKVGAHIRNICPTLLPIARPLGHSILETLGFGSTIVTYRNCPNNTPLAFWVGNPWYPLFPRKINADTRIDAFFREVSGGNT